MKDNKLIADFMELEVDNGLYCYTTAMDDYKTDTLYFHSSWDWLMPVIEKIEEQNELIGAHILSTDIGKTYKEVVRFIKEYNNDPLGTKSIHD